MPHPRELPIPRPCANEQQAVELARVWMIPNTGQHVSLSTGVVGNPNAWGILLVNLAKHVANAYQQAHNLDANQTLSAIKAACDKEWNAPTDQPRGEVLKPGQGGNPE